MASNDLVNDPRVTRHARSLGKHGYDVVVLGVKTRRTVPIENRRHYKILRITLKTHNKLQGLADNIKRRHMEARARLGQGESYAVAAESPSFVRNLFRRVSDATVVLSRFLDMNLRVAKVARSLRADIYTSNDLDTLLAGVIACGSRRRLIYDSHEMWVDMWSPIPHYIRAVLYNFEKALIRKAHMVMSVNEFIARELARRYDIQIPHVVLNCAERPDKPLDVRHNASGKKVALYQGRYASGRGLENLVLSSQHLEHDVVLLLRGFGELEPRLRELARDRSNCRFADPVPMEEMTVKAAEAHIGIIPYLPTNLGYSLASPNKLFEYMQAGIPVAVSDLPFLKKIVLEEDIGLTFDPYDPKDIASAINRITRDKELMRLKRNVQRAAKKYDWSSEEQKLLEVYETVMRARLH